MMAAKLEWVRTQSGDWVTREGTRRFGWLIGVNDAGVFQVNAEAFSSLADAQQWCQAQSDAWSEDAAAPPAELPSPGDVWGVPGKPETRRFVVLADLRDVRACDLRGMMLIPLPEWDAWVRDTGAVRIDGEGERLADARALCEELRERVAALEAEGDKLRAEIVERDKWIARLRKERDDAQSANGRLMEALRGVATEPNRRGESWQHIALTMRRMAREAIAKEEVVKS